MIQLWIWVYDGLEIVVTEEERDLVKPSFSHHLSFGKANQGLNCIAGVETRLL